MCPAISLADRAAAPAVRSDSRAPHSRECGAARALATARRPRKSSGQSRIYARRHSAEVRGRRASAEAGSAESRGGRRARVARSTTLATRCLLAGRAPMPPRTPLPWHTAECPLAAPSAPTPRPDRGPRSRGTPPRAPWPHPARPPPDPTADPAGEGLVLPRRGAVQARVPGHLGGSHAPGGQRPRAVPTGPGVAAALSVVGPGACQAPAGRSPRSGRRPGCERRPVRRGGDRPRPASGPAVRSSRTVVGPSRASASGRSAQATARDAARARVGLPQEGPGGALAEPRPL